MPGIDTCDYYFYYYYYYTRFTRDPVYYLCCASGVDMCTRVNGSKPNIAIIASSMFYSEWEKKHLCCAAFSASDLLCIKHTQREDSSFPRLKYSFKKKKRSLTFFFFLKITFTPSTDTTMWTFFFLMFFTLNSYCTEKTENRVVLKLFVV